MKLHNLKPADGSTHYRRRIGRGQGSGMGGTSTRGHKGAKSRSGYSRKIGFEGGQMPLQRRLPKFGFKNINHISYQPVNLSTIQKMADAGITTIGLDELKAAGVVKKGQLAKVLAKGKLTAKVDVSAHAFSASAEVAIKELGGSVSKL